MANVMKQPDVKYIKWQEGMRVTGKLEMSPKHYGDGVEIRRCAAENNVTMLTSLDTVRMLLDVLEEMTIGISTIDSVRDTEVNVES